MNVLCTFSYRHGHLHSGVRLVARDGEVLKPGGKINTHRDTSSLERDPHQLTETERVALFCRVVVEPRITSARAVTVLPSAAASTTTRTIKLNGRLVGWRNGMHGTHASARVIF